MVERNLAKVEVESSRLFSRSNIRTLTACLQSNKNWALPQCHPVFAGQCRIGQASMVKLVDTADLKSAAFLHKGRTGSIPVRGTISGNKK